MKVTMLLANVNSPGNSSWSNIFSVIAQLFLVLVVFAAILYFAIAVTRLMSRSKYAKSGNYNMKIIESMNLGMQNGIHLLQVGKKYILLGITKEKISFLTEIQEDDIFVDETDHTKTFPSFEKYLAQIKQNKLNRKDD